MGTSDQLIDLGGRRLRAPATSRCGVTSRRRFATPRAADVVCISRKLVVEIDGRRLEFGDTTYVLVLIA
jgi:hypothetical protein